MTADNNNDSVNDLKKQVEKKQKIINSLIKHVESLSSTQASFLSNMQTASALEKRIKKQKEELSNAQKETSASQALLETERQQHEITLSSISEGVISTNCDGVIVYLNPSAETLLGLTQAQVIDQPLNNIFTVIDNDSKLPIDLPSDTPDEFDDINIINQPVLKRYDNSEIVIDWSFSPIKDQQGNHQGLVITFKDITGSYHLNLELEHRAAHDSLTGLLNRHEFDKRLKNLLSTRNKISAKHTLIYIDLDQFKVVNDTCGHEAGDRLLKQLGAIMKPKVRGRDTLARIGGDEFAVLLENCPKKAATKIAESLLHSVQEYRFLWENKFFDVGASLGVAHFSTGHLISNDPLGAADAACYKAKELGRNRIHEVDISEQVSTEDVPHAEMQWVSKVSSALEENGFVLHQQRIVPTNPGMTDQLRYEILLRMKGENGDLIPPGAFLPAAERYNLIHKVDRWVIENTFKWLTTHPSVLVETDLCSINLSGLSLSDHALSDFVKSCFIKYDINGQNICFEITETAAIHNFELATNFMKNMHQLGCSFSLDDFGTGMSSFSYLKQLPVNHLKIDGSFVRDIADDPIDLAMTRSINEIGHVMGITTIAEFVENEEILQLIKQLGVDYVQGYHIAKPAPLDDLST
jgi:diguanylate cyclase (GGDEF)-like protein/PAS domain S-box-containing protein